MTALVAVEVRRMVSRRLVRVLALLALLSFVIAGFAVYFQASEDQPVSLADLIDAFRGTSGFFVSLAWVAGASFIGAEWHHKTIVTTLTWEPRRERVLAGKALAAGAVAAVGTVGLLPLLGVALLPAAQAYGTGEGIDSAWVREAAGVILRAGFVAGLAAVVGFAVASIARNTAGSLAAGFVYAYVVEAVLRSLRPGWEPWLFVTNAVVVVNGRAPDDATYARSAPAAALVLAAYTGALLAVAIVLFRRRDVT